MENGDSIKIEKFKSIKDFQLSSRKIDRKFPSFSSGSSSVSG